MSLFFNFNFFKVYSCTDSREYQIEEIKDKDVFYVDDNKEIKKLTEGQKKAILSLYKIGQ